MGICQPDSSYIVNVKKYNRPNEYLSLTITECVNLLKAQNSSYDLFFFDPYNYPYIIGGFTLPAGITDLYFINDEKYTTYTNMVAARGENNGTAVNVLNTSMSMYVVYQDGTRLLGAGVAHNFTSRQFDDVYYREADGSYQYPYILYTSRTDINIYINGNKIVNTKIKVNYYLPDYDYTYAKITYKQDSEPASETDGESVEILKDETSVNIEGLEEEKTYYFKIFTDKSESEAFPFTVGEIPGPIIPPDLQPYVDLLASYGVGTNQTSSLTNCQDYSGNSNTVSMEGYSVCIDGNFNVNGNQYFMYIMSNCDIRVTNNNGSISVEYSCTMAPYDTIRTWGRSMWGEYSHSGNRIEYLALGTWTPAVPLDFYQPYNVDNVGITFTTSFDSMVNCMNYLTQHFRRCNLYVDGTQWLNVN